jgi:hypothetical protein
LQVRGQGSCILAVPFFYQISPLLIQYADTCGSMTSSWQQKHGCIKYDSTTGKTIQMSKLNIPNKTFLVHYNNPYKVYNLCSYISVINATNWQTLIRSLRTIREKWFCNRRTLYPNFVTIRSKNYLWYGCLNLIKYDTIFKKIWFWPGITSRHVTFLKITPVFHYLVIQFRLIIAI